VGWRGYKYFGLMNLPGELSHCHFYFCFGLFPVVLVLFAVVCLICSICNILFLLIITANMVYGPWHCSLHQWKLAFISMNWPEYLYDTDIVSARFQVCDCLQHLSSLKCIPFLVLHASTLCSFPWLYRGEMFMVLGNSILAWSTLMQPRSDHTQPIR
jgi:hypothetical protein